MKVWIARELNGKLGSFTGKPFFHKEFMLWVVNPCFEYKFIGYLNDGDFPEVTFENSPMEVELVIKNVCSKS